MEIFPFAYLDLGFKFLIETVLIAVIIYFTYRSVEGSYAIPAMIGVFLIVFVNGLVSLLGLNTINFILRKIMDVGILAVFIIFQPEIRRMLNSLGKKSKMWRFLKSKSSMEYEEIVNEVIEAIKVLTRTKTGGLMVFIRSGMVQDVHDKGIEIDAHIRSSLIVTIFNVKTPLHDGAILIKGDKITRAKVLLPLSNDVNLQQNLGSRHRAAVGATENNDVFVVAVSEETGRISFAESGNLESGLTIQTLRQKINEQYEQMTSSEKAEDVVFDKSKPETA